MVRSPITECVTAPQGAACAEFFRRAQEPLLPRRRRGLTQTFGWVDAWTSGRASTRSPPRRRGRRRRRGQFRPRAQAAARRQGRRPQLPGHVQRAGLAAGLDAPDERDHAARRLRRRRAAPASARRSPPSPSSAGRDLDARLRRGDDARRAATSRAAAAPPSASPGLSRAAASAASRRPSAWPRRACSRPRSSPPTARCGSPTPARIPICSGRSRAAAAAASASSPGSPCGRMSCRSSSARSFVTIKAASDAAFRRLIGRVIDFYAEPCSTRTGASRSPSARTTSLRSRWCSRGWTSGRREAVWRPFLDCGRGLAATISSVESRRCRSSRRSGAATSGTPLPEGACPASSLVDDRPGAPPSNVFWAGDRGEAGQFLHGYQSAWLPASLLQPDQPAALVDALFAASRHWGCRCISTRGSPARPPRTSRGPGHGDQPGRADAFALVICGAEGPPAYPGVAGHEPDLPLARRHAAAIDSAMKEMRARLPAAGSYVSESNDFFEPTGARLLGRELRAAAGGEGRVRPRRASSSCTTASAASAGARTASSGCPDVPASTYFRCGAPVFEVWWAPRPHPREGPCFVSRCSPPSCSASPRPRPPTIRSAPDHRRGVSGRRHGRHRRAPDGGLDEEDVHEGRRRPQPARRGRFRGHGGGRAGEARRLHRHPRAELDPRDPSPAQRAAVQDARTTTSPS